MDSEAFKSFRLLFKAFAFEPLDGFSFSWIYLHGVFCAAQFVVVFIFQDNILYTVEIIGNFCDLIKFYTRFLSYGSGIFISWLYKIREEKFKIEKANLEALMDELYVDHEKIPESFRRTFKVKYFLLLFQIFLMVQEMILKSDERQSFNYAVAFTFPAVFCTLKLLHVIFYIDLKNKYFEVLVNQLQHVNTLIGMNELKLKNENLYIHTLCNLYWLTFRIINHHWSFTKSKI
jgi:hypothetical protein